jgi:mRNA interferase MazF
MQRGEVWFINLDPTVGAEIRKTRPAVIVNDDAVGILPLKVILPITDWKEHYDVAPWMVKLEPNGQNGLNKMSAVDTFQVRSISQQRFSYKIGALSEKEMDAIGVALAAVLRIGR